MFDDKFRSRKFGIIVAVLSIATLGLFTGKLSGGEWAQVATFCGSAYIVGQSYVDSRQS